MLNGLSDQLLAGITKELLGLTVNEEQTSLSILMRMASGSGFQYGPETLFGHKLLLVRQPFSTPGGTHPRADGGRNETITRKNQLPKNINRIRNP